MMLMQLIIITLILSPAAIGGWIAGSRRGYLVLLGILLSLPTLLALLMLTDNAGDPPDMYPSTVLTMVFAEFMSIAVVGSFLSERRINAFKKQGQ